MTEIKRNIKSITNSGLEHTSLKKGDFVYRINEKPKFAYYVYTGEVNIISANHYKIGVVREGELFGEVSSLFNKEHSVSAQTAKDTRLLIIEKELFFNKIENADPVLKAVLRTLSVRLNDSNEKAEKIWKQLHLLSSIKKDISKN